MAKFYDLTKEDSARLNHPVLYAGDWIGVVQANTIISCKVVALSACGKVVTVAYKAMNPFSVHIDKCFLLAESPTDPNYGE